MALSLDNYKRYPENNTSTGSREFENQENVNPSHSSVGSVILRDSNNIRANAHAAYEPNSNSGS